MKQTIFVVAMLLVRAACAQEPSGAYHIDFTRFFASPDVEKAQRAEVTRELDALQAMRASVTQDGAHLLAALQLRDDVQTKLARHAIYLYLRYATDTRDTRSRDDREALYAESDAKTAFLTDEILRLTDDRAAQMIAAEPRLDRYRYEIESNRRWAPHTLSEPEEKLLAAAAPVALHWQFDLYEKLRAEKASPDLFAFTLMRIASSRTAFAHLRHFGDAASWTYFRSDFTRPAVRALLDRIAANAALYKRYQRLRASETPPPNFVAPHFAIDQARDLLLQATAPLGEEYAAQFRALLDPANGRMDIIPGPNRKTGGFSQGAIGTDSVFYSGGFTGTYDNVRVLMHEGTHAVQRQLMNANHVLPPYAVGPNYLAEALAMFNELNLADFMATHAADPAQKRFFLEQFLDGKGMIAFLVAPEADLEERVYDGVAAGTIRGPADLDALTARVYDRYTTGAPSGKWMNIPLMYEDPFYDLNYVYGGVVAIRLYAMYRADPKGFAPRYIAMMKNGYTAPPDVLLKRFFDIDLSDPRLLDDAVALLKARVDAISPPP